MMARTSGLIPARFLTIAAHLVITIVLFMSREQNIKACLPLSYTSEQYNQEDQRLIIGLSVSLGLFLLELIGFFGGISMFIHTTCMVSTAAHAGGAVALSYFMFDMWECTTFWYIFSFGSCLPAIAEMTAMIGVLVFNKGP